jgi:LPS sulfotransferase NodH
MICAVPRTGSYMLCDVLEKTELAGRPNEYFNDHFQAQWAVEWEAGSIDAYMCKVVEVGTSPNGVFGIKTHTMQFDDLCRQLAGRRRVPFVLRPELLDRWFPRLVYVRLRRLDPLRQAISYVRAIQTNGWWDSEHAPGPSGPVRPERVRFDFQLIERARELLGNMDQRWSDYFVAIGATPVELTYEGLVEDPQGAVQATLTMLGVSQLASRSDRPMPFRRQADDLTEDWIGRYERIRDGVSHTPTLSAVVEKPRDAPMRIDQWSRKASATMSASADRQPPEVAIERAGLVVTPQDCEVATLRGILRPIPWLRWARPFPHLVAQSVLREEFQARVASEFIRLLDAGAFETDGRCGVSKLDVVPTEQGPFAIFFSRAWLDLLARLFGRDASGDVSATLLYHPANSVGGSILHDYEPGGSAARSANADRQAVTVIYHLAHPTDPPCGGAIGLYSSKSQPVDRPTVQVPSAENSLLAFERTPYSLHSFMANKGSGRNSLVMWIHSSSAREYMDQTQHTP